MKLYKIEVLDYLGAYTSFVKEIRYLATDVPLEYVDFPDHSTISLLGEVEVRE